jgi:16S rRNA (adenine1518-N6/adenine1519-N6)-dimethyltransferase
MSEQFFKKKKSLGQNFLKSKSAIRSMVLSAEITPGETILEIGPGKGVLTEALLEAGATVIAVEKDDRLIPELQIRFQKEIASKQCTLIHGDILDLTIEEILGKTPYKVVANIPYYITGIQFQTLLEHSRPPEHIVVLIQKEVARRIVAHDKKGQGIGKLLTLKAEDFGKKLGAHKVYLQTGKGWEAEKFYQKLGYKETATLLNHHFHKDFVIYEKLI